MIGPRFRVRRGYFPDPHLLYQSFTRSTAYEIIHADGRPLSSEEVEELVAQMNAATRAEADQRDAKGGPSHG